MTCGEGQTVQAAALKQRYPTFLVPGTGFVEDNFSMDGVGGLGSNVSDGERWGEEDEASLARPPLTSFCATQFLTGRRLVLVCSLGVGDSCSKGIAELIKVHSL